MDHTVVEAVARALSSFNAIACRGSLVRSVAVGRSESYKIDDCGVCEEHGS